jgi:succinyl-diaminopimelate desuccinylase
MVCLVTADATRQVPAPDGDLLVERTAELVDIPSVSHDEAAIGDHVASVLAAGAPWLELHSLGANVVARTSLGHPSRLVLAGHTDTVPPKGNEGATVDGGTVRGVGSSDMKGGLAVMLELALRTPAPAVDLTFVFYACEEVERRHSGLLAVESERPDLLVGDAAVLGEPTDVVVEAGCQGVLRVRVVLRGVRAHTARPWVGRNAIHRLAPLLARCAAWEGRRPVLDGCEYREALQVVDVSGGVAGNVVPDEARVLVDHRFAPDRDADEAFTAVAEWLAPALSTDDGDEISIASAAPSAAPGLGHPLLASLVTASGCPPRAKLGWTDVAFFSERGIPAANYGPGDPLLAHTAGEHVRRDQLEAAYATLAGLVAVPATAGRS